MLLDAQPYVFVLASLCFFGVTAWKFIPFKFFICYTRCPMCFDHNSFTIDNHIFKADVTCHSCGCTFTHVVKKEVND